MANAEPPGINPGSELARTIVFTDLDGTLLDDDYNLSSAAAAMDELSRLAAIVVPVSSKTLPELQALTAQRRIAAPMIFENGAGIAWPADFGSAQQISVQESGSVEVFGRPYAELCQILRDLRRADGYLFRGFADMCAAEISKLTYLTEPAAALAKQRRASEPICWADTNEQFLRFKRALQAFDLQLQHGGRFAHVMPLRDKSQAASRVQQVYQRATTLPLITVACGDSPNDRALLAFADACVLFPQRNGRYLSVTGKPLRYAPRPGHRDWLDVTTQLLQEFTGE